MILKIRSDISACWAPYFCILGLFLRLSLNLHVYINEPFHLPITEMLTLTILCGCVVGIETRPQVNFQTKDAVTICFHLQLVLDMTALALYDIGELPSRLTLP